MDNSDVFGLEFLDLNGVDDNERRWVLASISSNKPDTNFPWFIGDENICDQREQEKLKPTTNPAQYADTEPATVSIQNAYPTHADSQIPPTNLHYNLPVTEHIPNASSVPLLPVASTADLSVNDVMPIVSTTAVPLNSQYYPPQYIQPLGAIPIQSYSNVPVTVVYTTYPAYPVKSPVYYGVPPTQQIFVTQTNTCMTPNTQQHFFATQPDTLVTNSYENVNGGVSHDYVNTSTNYDQGQNMVNGSFEPVEQEIDQVPVDINSQYDVNSVEDNGEKFMSNGPVASENTANGYLDETQSGVSEMPVVNIVQAPEEKSADAVAQPSPWGGGAKSWASLFTPDTPKQVAVVSSTLNGTVQPPTPEAVKKSNAGQSCSFKHPKKDFFVDPDCYRMGEFLSTYTIDGRTFSLQPKGLINQSNYCYINSILQALIACPPMYNLLIGLEQNITSNEKRKKTPVIDGICKFVKEFKQLPANMRVTRRSDPKSQKKEQGALINTDIPFEPAWIYKMLNGIRTDLIEGRQEDAEEFLCCLLNNLNDEMLELIKLVKNEDSDQQTVSNHISTEEEDREWQVMGPKNKGSVSRRTVFESTPITDIFGGSLKSRIQRTGDNATENTQPFFTLQLNIEKVKTVKEALEALTNKYQLEGLTSLKTNEQVEAWQQVMLDKLPIILVLHLKCFDFKLDGCTKIIKALEFPIDLKIDSKLLSSAKVSDPKQKQYKLFAVVYHDGKEATKGHYVTDAFHVGYSSWLRYDDASVKSVQEEQVLNPQGTRVPYLLFYRRSDTIRSR